MQLCNRTSVMVRQRAFFPSTTDHPMCADALTHRLIANKVTTSYSPQ